MLCEQRILKVCATRPSRTFSVTLNRPLGLILLPRDGNQGACVDEVLPGGNADTLGTIAEGDSICSISTSGNAITECGSRGFDEIVSFISEHQVLNVVFERAQLLPAQDQDTSKYWQNKLKSPAVLRRTVGVQPEDIKVSKTGPIGSGNFGIVFKGSWKGMEVALKCAKTNVYGAAELLDAELQLNESVHKWAKGSCAKFLGCCEVDPRYEGQIYNGSLQAGLWLMWERGTSTLGDLLEMPNAEIIARVSGAHGLSNNISFFEIVRTIMRSILFNLKTLHNAGIVHRDVKPDNVLLTSSGFVFIDLGAAAQCLRAPVNYSPGIGPADPRYCRANDTYLLPSDAPEPALNNLEELWQKYQPNKFDLFSAGMIMLQLSISELRDDKNFMQFGKQLELCNFDLLEWRTRYCTTSCKTVLTDEGWNLAASLLQGDRELRSTAENALNHSFFDA